MQGARSAYTRARILDAAERLFAEKGHDATSLREITAMAGVNLSSVNYHFGSKDGLVQAVCQRRLNALNRERVAILDHLEACAGGMPLKPVEIVGAFFHPLLRYALGYPEERPSTLPAHKRSFRYRNDFTRPLIVNTHVEILVRFRAALQKSLPDMPEQEILWRFHFMLGATFHAISEADGLPLALDSDRNTADTADIGRLTLRLMSFLMGGLLAPLPTAENDAGATVQDVRSSCSGTSRGHPDS